MKTNFLEKTGRKLLAGIFLASLVTTISVNSFAGPATYITNNPDGSQTLGGHQYTGPATVLSHATGLYINAQIIMPLSNQAGLDALLDPQNPKSLYNPQSPNYHQFLTPAQFSENFAPSVSDVTQVQELLKPYGISVVSQTGGVLNVTGPSSSFERAFGLKINNYRNTNGNTFFAPDADPTIPAYLAGKILAIGGLDNLPKYFAHSHQSAANAVPVPNAIKPNTSKAVTGSGPGGYLAPGDVKTAYNLNAVPSTGAGQSVALFELDGYNPSDISTYLSHFNLSTSNISNPCSYKSSTPNTVVNFNNAGSCGSNIIQNILMDNFSGVPNWPSGGPYEVTLDIDLVAAFAPGSKNILVYEAPNTTQGWIDEWTQMATDNKAKAISCSWGEPEVDSPTIVFDNQIFQQMASQGQAVFVAAGDNGAYDAGGKTLGVDEPASQPFATGVGISALTVTSSPAPYTYSSESASLYGGGGISGPWAIPSYQTALFAKMPPVSAAKVSTTKRNVPDVSLTADPSTCYAFYMSIPGSTGWYGFWGSSLAAPIWASFISRVNQGLGSSAPIGLVNSTLYQLAQNSSSYASDFHKIITGNNGYYPAESGYNDATGLGSFNGLNLYNDLVKNAAPATVPTAPSNLSATAGNAQVTLSWTASSTAGVTYDVYRSTSSGGTYSLLTSSLGSTSFTDTSATNGTLYYYKASAVNLAGQTYSGVASATPLLPAPSTPTGLQAVGGISQVILTWTAVPGAVSYNVKIASSSGGTYSPIATVSSTGYTNGSLTNGTTYYYEVSAANTAGTSSNSTYVSATPLAVPNAPANMNGSITSGKSPIISLSWTQSNSPGIAYNNVYYTIKGSGTVYLLYRSSQPFTSLGNITGASASSTYNFYVTAVNVNGQESVSSNVKSIVG